MQTSVDTIVKNIFQADTLLDLSTTDIQEYINKYPFASVGHLLLAKKQQQEQVDFTDAASAAALYVSNPLWLHGLLKTPTPEADVFTGKTIKHEPVTNQDPGPEVDTYPDPVIKNPPVIPEATLPPAMPEAVEVAERAVSEEEVEVQAVDPVETALAATPVAEKTVDEEALAFEPYHTIDYFASQGIKLTAEDLTKDKFGRQLKSFTEWLRSMKRITPVQLNEAASAPVDESIQKTAEASVSGDDVETEAMAEVWAKQGKTAKAKAIYEKLSLLNPSKSHYFAAKIEQLND